MIKRTFCLKLLLCILLGVSAPTSATLITAGTPTTTVPNDLFDPLCPAFCTLTSPLPGNEFLLPIEITGANTLQDWSFDLNFNDGVVAPVDAGGLYQSVYQAEFNASDPTLSNITSSGFLLPGSPQDTLQGVAGFSSGVSGNGLLAYILFDQLVPGANPGFSISGVTVAQAPEPGTLALFAAALLILAFTSRRPGRLRLPNEGWRQ